MPWSVWFAYLTAPPLVGVAYTLASSRPDNPGSYTVPSVAAVWLLVAYRLQKRLRRTRPDAWARRWLVLTVAVPLVVCFGRSIRHDAPTLDVLHVWTDPGRTPPGATAAASPTRAAPSWNEVGEFLACVRHPAGRFSLQLLTALPPVWWFGAFFVAVRKGD